MQIKRMRNRLLDKLRFNRFFNSFLEEMETSTLVSYGTLLLYIITSKSCSGLSRKLLYEYQLEGTFCNFTCPVEDTIFHVNEVQSEVMCTLLCSNTRPCFGAFFHPGTKECIGCNSTTELLPLDSTLFYRQGNWYFLIFFQHLISVPFSYIWFMFM